MSEHHQTLNFRQCHTHGDLTQFAIADLQSSVSVGLLHGLLLAAGRTARLAFLTQITQIELIELRAFAALQFTPAKAEFQALLVVVRLSFGIQLAECDDSQKESQN